MNVALTTLKKRIHTYLRLMRFHAAGLESSFVLLGALTIGMRNSLSLFIIFVIGVLCHNFFHVSNEYADIEIDKKSDDLRNKPLVSGSIQKKHALYLIVLHVILIYALTIIFFFSIYTFSLLSLALLLGTVYNWYGKKVPCFSDFIIAGTATCLFFYGSSIFTFHFSTIVYIIGGIIFFSIVFANAVEGGLKDADHDYLNGGKTIAIVMGVKVKGAQLVITKKFRAFSYGILFICFLLFSFLIIQPELNLWTADNYYLQGIIVFLIAGIIIYIHKILNMKIFDRAKMKNLFVILNSGVGISLFISLTYLLGIPITLILLTLPITWYIIFNLVLYGKLLQPEI